MGRLLCPLRLLPKRKRMRRSRRLQELYALLAEAEGIIFASPVYNGG